MIIRTFRELVDSLYKVKINTEDFRSVDADLLQNYGEPEINIGGYFETAPAVASYLTIEFPGLPNGETVTIGDGTNTVIFEIKNTAAPLVNLNAIPVSNDVGDPLTNFEVAIEGSSLLVTASILVDVLTVTHDEVDTNLTFSTDGEGDVTGVVTPFVPPTSPYFTLPDNFSLIKSGSPFTQAFDKKDYPDAESRADLWASEVTDRIKDAMVTLRALEDTFTGETTETF